MVLTADAVDAEIDQGVDSINNTVRNELGRCVPVYNAYSVIIDAVCVELLYPVNGYWFALGWSAFFLIIIVILSFKLTTLYRRTYKRKKQISPEKESWM